MATKVKTALNPHDVYRKPLSLRLKENRQMYVSCWFRSSGC